MTFEGKDINRLQKDENLRAKNFDAFEKRYGFRPFIDSTEDDQYRMERSRDGQPVLFIRNALRNGDLRLNSSYSPTYEVIRLSAKQPAAARRTTIALCGFEAGYYLRALMEKYRPDTAFFVYEPQESLFSYVCAYVDVTDIISHKRVKLFINEKQHNLMAAEMIRDLATFKPETIALVTPFYSKDDTFSNICHQLESLMASANDFQKERAKKALICRLYAWNHMKDNMVFTALQERIPKDIPAVIVSAGPSLNKNVHVLGRIKNHALIMSTDRALSALEKYNIVPDVVVTMDAEKNSRFLMMDIAKKSHLLCSYQTNIDTQKLYDGRCIYFHPLKYEKELIGDKVGRQVPDLGGNVAGGSFVLCELLGIKTIILMGQDLAYLDGKHHADDSPDGEMNLAIHEVEGIDGKPVKTNEAWIGFRDFFERQINMFSDLRVIDATEGGALIHGSDIMTLEEVADNICTKFFDYEDIFDNLPKAQTEEENLNTKSKLRGWIKELDMIESNSNELVKICEQLLEVSRTGDINDPGNRSAKDKLAELKFELHNSTAYSLLEEFWIKDLYGIPDIFVFLRDNEEAIATLGALKKFYEELPEDCRSLKEEIEKSLND